MKDQGKRVDRLEAALGEGEEPFNVELVRGPTLTKEEAAALPPSVWQRGTRVTRIELVGVSACQIVPLRLAGAEDR